MLVFVYYYCYIIFIKNDKYGHFHTENIPQLFFLEGGVGLKYNLCQNFIKKIKKI